MPAGESLDFIKGGAMPEGNPEPPLAAINEPKLLKVAQLRRSLRRLCRACVCGNALARNFFNAAAGL
jgi:hypothetical protein